MGTKNTVYLISGGTNYYLSGGANTQTAYSGSGTPWTAETTTPYELSLNEYTPIWVAQPAPAQVLWSGGPPFTNGSRPVVRSFGNVTEQIGVQMRATSKDNAIALLRQLRRILNTPAVPCILAVQGGTNPGYTEIYNADVPETPDYIKEPDGIFRATITWTRYPFFGLLNGGEILINAVTVNNTGTGSPDNLEAYAAGTGDLIDEGSPLNVALTPATVITSIGRLYAASVVSRTYTTSGAAAYSTSSTTGLFAYALTGFALTSCLTDHHLKPRVLVRSSTNSSNVQLRFVVSFAGDGVVYTSPWVSPPTSGAATITDLGYFSVDVLRRRIKGITAPTATLSISIRSTNGSSANVTVTYSELLLYHTFAQIDKPSAATAVTLSPLQTDVFQEQTGAAAIPHQVSNVILRASGDIDTVYDYRGTLPAYISGDSIYLAWLDASLVHSTTATASLTVTHAPQWRSVRGST